MVAQDWDWLKAKTYLLKGGKKGLSLCAYIYIYTFNIKARASHNFTSMSPEKGWLIKRRING